jgi:DUF1680 family protein
MQSPHDLSRRRLLQGAFCASVASSLGMPRISRSQQLSAVRPLPLSAVRRGPSPWLRAVEANRSYLHRLDPDRLLQGYRVAAGLAPRGESYGGWEQDTIAGHTLGHYLSACALMHAQTGDAECRSRAAYIVDELAACQAAGRDGFVAAFTRRAGGTGTIEPGRRVMEELARGEIRSARFYLNGCWAPFYNWHKLFAGLLDTHAHCGSRRAIDVCERLAGFIESVLASLDHDGMQAVLGTEFGGMSEALAELSARSGDGRWLALAQRFHHDAVLAPLMAGRDELAYLHANTQIPKVIGLARHAELAGHARELEGARFFWRAVTGGRSYVIGGNSDREYFQEPGSLSRYVTEQTCESCNTYNMLKLTRRLFAAEPDAVYFDYYERAHLNHILAHQRPDDGAFAYMVPLMSGAAREWSTPFDSFWCCVGTGMESHAKHGDSIFWEGDGTLYVNLYIPATLDWRERGMRVALATAYPFEDHVTLRFESTGDGGPLDLALRIPGWCDAPVARLNGGNAASIVGRDGYLRIRRRWRPGDSIELALPMKLRFEPTPDDPSTIALLHGPVVLAADLGAAEAAYEKPAPALVGEDLLAGISAVDRHEARFRTRRIGQPADLDLAPFYAQYDRRTAVYFKRYTPAGWQAAVAARAAQREREAELDARSVDIIRLGVAADEGCHGLTGEFSYAVSYRFRPGRDARTGGFLEFDAAVGDVPLVLRVTYWGGERDRLFHIQVDGRQIATQRLHGENPGEFIDRDYALPPEIVRGKRRVRIRFQPEDGYTAGPLFGCRILAADGELPPGAVAVTQPCDGRPGS